MTFKLQALQIRLITYPSQGEDKEISLRALLKKRAHKLRYKTGVWEDIWIEQAKIKVNPQRRNSDMRRDRWLLKSLAQWGTRCRNM